MKQKKLFSTSLSPCRVSATGGRNPIYRVGGGKLLLILLATLLFTSCLTVGRIERNCDKFAQICVTEKETVTVYRDTTIYLRDTIRVPLPFRDTVKITDTVRIVNNMAWLPPVRKRFGIIEVDASVARSILNVNAYLTDSTILHARSDTILLEKVIKEDAITQTVVVKHVPKFYKVLLWIFIFQVLAAIGWFFLRNKIGKYVDRIIRKR